MGNIFKKYLKSYTSPQIYSLIKGGNDFVTLLTSIGNKYHCPFCNGRFSKLLPTGLLFSVLKEKQVIGGGYRLNATCPRCYSNDRERLIYLYLKKEQNQVFSESLKLLHIAPETNLAIKLKSNQMIDYTSADLSSPLVDIQMDITNINQCDNTYDVIICNHILEHIIDDAKAMRELFRVLKNGGFAILQVPISYTIEQTFEDSTITSPEGRELVFGQNDHVRIYGKDYILRLEEAGFSVTNHNFIESLKLEDINKFSLNKKENIFLCTK